MKPTALELLGLPEGATADEIKRRYRVLAFELHPDRNPAPDAAEKFAQVTVAYDSAMKYTATPRRSGKCSTCKGTRRVLESHGFRTITTACPVCVVKGKR